MIPEERRKYERLKRPFVVSYNALGDPSATYDITQIKDISLGGMRFITSKGYMPNTRLNIELRLPFMEEKVKLKARVIESKEVVKDLIYDTRVCFKELEEEAQEILSKTINLFLKKDRGKEVK
ncbi:MAG: PilZ domain-containing protein [Candidatus Omnitrophota bacterium]|nr:PilZ domain-containing protein [Candidatus Omnitrophota bacterium]